MLVRNSRFELGFCEHSNVDIINHHLVMNQMRFVAQGGAIYDTKLGGISVTSNVIVRMQIVCYCFGKVIYCSRWYCLQVYQRLSLSLVF